LTFIIDAGVRQNGDHEDMENVNDLLKKGKESYDSGKFNESIKYFTDAAQLDPKNAIAFNNWGNALYNLAKTNKDELLFIESCERFADAVQIKPDYNTAYNSLKDALSVFDRIRWDQLYLSKSSEKYASAFFNLGLKLSKLAETRDEELLFEESCKKYEKAAQIKNDYISALQNWGLALYGLARKKNNKPLFMELCKKFIEAVKKAGNRPKDFHIWGEVLNDFSNEYQDVSLFIDALISFIKSGKNVLEILFYFDDKPFIERNKKIEIIKLLLNYDSDEKRFFEETTKFVNDETKLDKYKEAYIISLLIIKQLHINNINEKLVATYRERTIVQGMLFKDSKFRLNDINYSNDPTEGRILFDYLFGKGKQENDSLNKEFSAFAACFIFNNDSLNQFRLYGKEDGREGTGLSLVFKDSFFSEKPQMGHEQPENKESYFGEGEKALVEQLQQKKENGNDEEGKKHSLFRCIYIDPDIPRVETVGHKEDYLFFPDKKWYGTDKEFKNKIDSYHKQINDIIENVRGEIENLKVLAGKLDTALVKQLLLYLRYFIKHIAFREENECRIIRICRLKNNEQINLSDDNKKMYVEYEPVVSRHIEKIIFGPKADGIELFRDILMHKDLNILCERSKNPLA